MRILFVYTEIGVRYGSYGFQNGIAALSAYLKRSGYSDISLFYAGNRRRAAEFPQVLAQRRPDIVGFYSTHHQWRFVKDMIAAVPTGPFTLCGGTLPILDHGILDEAPRLDGICTGEGELPLLETVRTLERGERPAGIAGLDIRMPDGSVSSLPPLPFLEDLDTLPYCDRDLFAAGGRRTGITQISYRNSFHIGRGCPFLCGFCSNRQLGAAQPGRYTRFRSVAGVLEEMAQVSARHDPGVLYIQDDTFTLDPDFIDAFCQGYPQKVGLPFEFFARIGPHTVDMLRKLRRAGGTRVSFGIESGSEKVRRDVLNKRFSNDDIVRTFREAKRMGFQTEMFLLIGIPDETPELFAETTELARRVQPDLYTLSTFFPYRGTDLHRYSMEKGYLAPGWEPGPSFVPQRDVPLTMPMFPPAGIRRAARRFPLKVFLKRSPLKALVFFLYESRYGDLLLRAVFFGRLLRRLVMRLSSSRGRPGNGMFLS